MPKLVLISISIFNFCIAVFGWGRPIHYYVNYQAVISVPDEMAAFRNYASWIGSHASDVDRWKSYVEEERYRHYFDLDFYGEYPFKNVPRNLKTLIETYGRKTVRENGVVPWTIEHKYN
ncbi:MAG: S1/P1 Nuclease, partial [Elusimicrobiota bacterium]